MNIRKLLITIALCMVLIIPQTGCGAKEPVSQEFFALDTVCTITVYGMSKNQAEEIITDAIELCSHYENLLSKTVEGSDVYRINNSGGAPVEVDEETIDVIEKGIELGELSDGKFDITIGAVSSLWDFKSEDPQVPDDADIKAAVKTVDYAQIEIEGNKVSLGIEGAQLDLGGIAKGYIADRVAQQMKDAGAEHAIINLGGNVVTIGSKADGSSWRVGIERPYTDRTELIGAVECMEATVTTSGVYERCFVQDGVTYHHVLDPETGYPVETEKEAVTVKGPAGMSAESDALGTILLMMDQDECAEILEKYPDFQVAFIDVNDEIETVNDLEILPVE